MIMRKSFCLLLPAAVTCLLFTHLYAAYSAQVLSFRVSPDYARPGSVVTFNLALTNTGAESWLKDTYEVVIKLYDGEKKYITKILQPGDSELPAGQVYSREIPYRVPEEAAGKNYVKIFIFTRDKGYIFESEYYGFSVEPGKILKYGGNMVFSLKDSSINNWSDYTGNISLNVVGKTFENPFSFNAYTHHTRDKNIDFRSLIFNYYGKSFTLNAGDLMPEFTGLTLSGGGARGVNLIHRAGRFKTSVLGMNLAESKNKTDTAAASFARYTTGLREEITLPNNLNIGINLLKNFDDKNSVSETDRAEGLISYDNNLASLDLKYQKAELLSFSGEYAFSGLTETGSSGPGEARGGRAYGVKAEVNFRDQSVAAGYRYSGYDFRSLGSSSSPEDRKIYSLEGNFSFLNRFSLFARLRNSSDNVENRADKVKTDENLLSGALSVRIFDWLNPGISYSSSRMESSPKSFIDNLTESLSLNTGLILRGTNISFKYQNTVYNDRTGAGGKITTDNINISLSGNISAIPFSLGSGYSYMRDAAGNILDRTLFGRINTNLKAGKNLSFIPWLIISDNRKESQGNSLIENRLSVETVYSLNNNASINIISGFVNTSGRQPGTTDNNLELDMKFVFGF